MSNQLPVGVFLEKYNIQPVIESAINECFKAQATNPTAFLAEYFTKLTKQTSISNVKARQVLDSRGNPTVEVDVYCGNSERVTGRASAPSGASTGSNEANEMRDEDDSKYLGKGVLKAVGKVNNEIKEVLLEKNVLNLRECDQAMIDKDGSELKVNLGGNSITAASFALAVAGAKVAQEELFFHLAKQFLGTDDLSDHTFSLPTPLVNILNGGKHAGTGIKIQEFMIVPRKDIHFSEQLRYCTEVYHHLKKIVVDKKGVTAKNVGDEGGFAPNMSTPDEALSAIEEAIKSAGYEVGKDIFLALDCAASEFYDAEKKKYEIISKKWVTSDELIAFYEKMVNDHPAIISIEDGLDEKDYDGWAKLTEQLGDKVQIVGDDLYTTNTRFIKEGIEKKWANALLLKVNQIGTISEAMDAAKMIFDAKQNVIVSHRSGETTTSLISDLAVAIGANQIKTGATARGERNCKYNRLLQIEEFLKEKNMLAPLRSSEE